MRDLFYAARSISITESAVDSLYRAKAARSDFSHMGQINPVFLITDCHVGFYDKNMITEAVLLCKKN